MATKSNTKLGKLLYSSLLRLHLNLHSLRLNRVLTMNGNSSLSGPVWILGRARVGNAKCCAAASCWAKRTKSAGVPPLHPSVLFSIVASPSYMAYMHVVRSRLKGTLPSTVGSHLREDVALTGAYCAVCRVPCAVCRAACCVSLVVL